MSSSSVRIKATGFAGAAILCITCGVGRQRGIQDRWLVLRDPMPGSVVLGEMWDGKTSYGGCFESVVRVDTALGSDREMTMTPADSDAAAPILELVGLRALARRVGAWELRGVGGQKATAVDPTPTLSDSCAPARDGLPELPVVTELLGYDSLVIAWTPDSSAAHRLALEDLQPVRDLPATIHVSPGRISIRRQEPVWVGYRAMALVGARPSDRARETAIGVQARWPGAPFSVTVTERVRSGEYVVVSARRDAPDTARRIDTLATSRTLTLGGARRSGRLPGGVYSIVLEQSARRDSARVSVTMRYTRYHVERFDDERDRARWRKCVGS